MPQTFGRKMKRYKKLVVSSVRLVFVLYFAGYGALKLHCHSRPLSASDPWTGPYPQNRITSSVRSWSDVDWNRDPIVITYRDPGLQVPSLVKATFNVVYLPIQRVDLISNRWAVRFLMLTVSPGQAGPNKAEISSLITPRGD